MVLTHGDLQKLLSVIETLSQAQLVTLDAAIRCRLASPQAGPSASAGGSPETTDPAGRATDGCASLADIEARFAADPRCPHCQSTNIGKWGSANGLGRTKCRPCNVTFNALTGSPLAQLHKRELWLGHAQALVDGIALRKVAARIDVDLTTAFRWRHRFLEVPKALKAEHLEGTVEADETYFLRSEKGSRKLERKARKRGGKATKPGLSDEHVPVLIACDRNAAMTDAILPDRSAKSISAVLGPLIDKSAILVSDGAKAFRAFADEARILHVALNLSEGEHRWGIYHVRHANSYDSRLKGWMRRFNGVATKYVDSYLGWHRTNDREKHTLTASRMLAAAWG
jgi:transposase-like protein